ncbi:MAG: hypothetical protein R6V62_01055 [Candidatus Fermentibacteraceae bacterium]
MNWSVVARGRSPSGEAVVHLCSRTGRQASEVRAGLVSQRGFVIREGLERDGADSLAASLSFHGITIEVVPSTGGPDAGGFRVVLTGYAPGSRGRLRAALMRMSGRTDEEVIGFLARIPFALRRGASPETAASVRRVIEAAGGVVEIRPEGNERPAPVPDKRFPQARVRKAPEAPAKTAAVSDTPPEAVVVPDPPVVRLHEDRSVLVEPHRFTPAPPALANIEPGRISPVGASFLQLPFKVLFTGPARLFPVPAAGSRRSFDALPAADVPACHPVFLCPVQEGDRSKAMRILQSSLGLSPDAAERAIAGAPSVISLEPGRNEASERVRELSGHGLPVTLIKHSDKEGPVRHRDHVWFGNWLRGR